jgi:hypothetical protein
MNTNGHQWERDTEIPDQHHRTPNVQTEHQIELLRDEIDFALEGLSQEEVRCVLTSLSVEDHALPKATSGRSHSKNQPPRETRTANLYGPRQSDIHASQFTRLDGNNQNDKVAFLPRLYSPQLA